MSSAITDAEVTTGVKTALLKDVARKRLDIQVITRKSEMGLVDVVDTQSQLDTTNKVTRGATGDHSIHDNLSIKK